ncbi:Rdx family-domain-containing protein [Armillaria fumosa]|nr:Rdx family-domain-containing protein [Armillaria fumosa]
MSSNEVPESASNLLDPSTFVFPTPSTTIIIEFCDRRPIYARLHRATWMQTELFLTFPPPLIGNISLHPLNSDETAGRFRVWITVGNESPHLLWDRKIEGGFPELKVLKQRVRDRVQPGRSLGHSDIKS